jgi:hypothetical protein
MAATAASNAGEKFSGILSESRRRMDMAPYQRSVREVRPVTWAQEGTA